MACVMEGETESDGNESLLRVRTVTPIVKCGLIPPSNRIYVNLINSFKIPASKVKTEVGS